ncbi:MAG: DUF2076 family protein [Gammaproteobacteria bacterium]|nr:DUF2076 family protein [Gammaproteobacteria bacterium]MBU0785419.1 DUF2076 family protein [Gammaproteobacteria bacterium]MBU0813620.1 DUF2076 family protein [Gammaproteobacteria bacterium]MBU1788909.1 DUF2076 family protein [Gammaproteobacteria bacterium]
MNPRERLMLIRLVARLVHKPEVVKDADAALDVEALLKARPDAPYLLMQRVLMLEAALEDVQLHLEQRAASPQKGVTYSASRNGQAAPAPSLAEEPPASASQPAVGAGMLGERLFFQGFESQLHGRGTGYLPGATQMPLDICEMQSHDHATQSPSRKVNTLFDASLGGVDDDLPDLDAGDGSWL